MLPDSGPDLQPTDSAMIEMELTVLQIKKELYHGEVRELAIKHGMKVHRAYDILSGRYRYREIDEAFLKECYDLALPRTQRKIKQA